jgi:hypothetical protein
MCKYSSGRLISRELCYKKLEGEDEHRYLVQCHGTRFVGEWRPKHVSSPEDAGLQRQLRRNVGFSVGGGSAEERPMSTWTSVPMEKKTGLASTSVKSGGVEVMKGRWMDRVNGEGAGGGHCRHGHRLTGLQDLLRRCRRSMQGGMGKGLCRQS